MMYRWKRCPEHPLVKQARKVHVLPPADFNRSSEARLESAGIREELTHSAIHLVASFPPSLRRQTLSIVIAMLSVYLLDRTKNPHQSEPLH